MRLRNDKNAKDKLSKFDYVYYFNNQSKPINLRNLFNSNNPIYLEVGMGKGDFIINNAIQNPNINFIGIEKFDTVILKATNKLKNINVNNLKIFCMDAELLNTIIPKHSISKIYLNFSDPWLKKRHHKRRLTHPNFLKKYYDILVDNGYVEFKTDNDNLFDWTINEVILFNPMNYLLIYKTTNLYNDLKNSYNINNISSEYEKKFVLLGKNINKAIFKIIDPEIK